MALVWFYVGRSDAGALEQDPGIPPPEYAYLDNGRVLADLAQIEGGLSESEKRTRRVIDTRTGGIAAGGVEVGGSTSSDQFVEVGASRSRGPGNPTSCSRSCLTASPGSGVCLQAR